MIEYLRAMVHDRVMTAPMVACYLCLGIILGATLYAAGYYASGEIQALLWHNLGVLGLAMFLLLGLPRMFRKPRGKSRWTQRLDDERERQRLSYESRHCKECGILFDYECEFLMHLCSHRVYY